MYGLTLLENNFPIEEKWIYATIALLEWNCNIIYASENMIERIGSTYIKLKPQATLVFEFWGIFANVSRRRCWRNVDVGSHFDLCSVRGVVKAIFTERSALHLVVLTIGLWQRLFSW